MAESKPGIAKWGSIARWVLIAIYAVAIVALSNYSNVGPTAILIIGAIFLLFHAPRRYTWKTIAIFALLAFCVSTILEDISIHTGFPFGLYYYNSPIANIDQVPFAVGIIYVSVAYLSWTVGSIVLRGADKHLDKKINIVALPVVSTFIMVQFDLVIDPITSTYQAAWVWENGGGFFGVPLVNFLGWYLTCYIFMQIFSIYLSKKQDQQPSLPELQTRQYWLQPVILYLLVGVSYVIQFVHFSGDTTVITDLAGNTWIAKNLYETATTVMLFTMLYSSVLAFVTIFQKDKESART